MADDSQLRPPVAMTTSTTTTTTHGPNTTTTTSYTSPGPDTTVTSSTRQSTTTTHPTITTTHNLQVPTPTPRAPATSIETQTQAGRRSPSIRIRRHNSDQALQTQRSSSEPVRSNNGRRRGHSDPQPHLAPTNSQNDLEISKVSTGIPLQTLQEEGPDTTAQQLESALEPNVSAPVHNAKRPGMGRQFSLASFRNRGQFGDTRNAEGPQSLYDAQTIDMLDVIDPEVATLTTLNNVQNSLFIPNLGWLYRRQPTYDLSQSLPDTPDEENAIDLAQGREDAEKGKQTEDGIDEQDFGESQAGATRPRVSRLETSNTISSVLTGMSEGHNYAVLPHGASLPGWTSEEKAALNDHVRHLLTSRRAKFKRSMRGFGRYVRKPVGFLVSLYAFLLTFWGAAWVLFLIGWISVEGRQAYFIEICDQILTALFCVVGIGLAPWRAIDTYHMIYIAHYAHLTWRLRRERGLPDLDDHNELPARSNSHSWETGNPEESQPDIVLTAAQQRNLEHHQGKFAASHSFYKPHETSTHRAFSLRLLIAIVVLLDCHSLFQMALGGTTWGIYYKHRPKALTAVILTCSISCNISAGLTITAGDRRSRKKLVVEQMFRQNVTEDALEDLRKTKGWRAKGVKGEMAGKDKDKKDKDKKDKVKKDKVKKNRFKLRKIKKGKKAG